MKLTLRNLGRLREATIDLDKDLILLTGPNNTSKTYVAHAIYGFQANMPRYAALAMDHAFEGYFSRSSNVAEPSIKINVLEFMDERLPSFVNALQSNFRGELADILASSEEFVTATQVVFDVDAAEIEQARQQLLERDVKKVRPELDFIESKPAGDPEWSFDVISSPISGSAPATSLPPHAQRSVLRHAWIRFASAIMVWVLRVRGSPHVLTAERAAIQLFSRELSLKRTELVDDLLRIDSFSRQAADAGEMLERTLGQRARRYPLAIRNSLRIANDVSNYRKTESPMAHLAQRMESDLLRGVIQIDDEGEVTFQPEGSGVHLGLPLSSSSVKSLAGLSFYLRHLAQEHQLLIIDEPELNLHPDNQRKVARVIARIVRSGIKVLVSTHSDYFIRELNNLIMLSADKDGSVRQRYGYDAQETLSPSQVGAYLFNAERANPIEVKPTGIEVETIDREINSLNTVSQGIYFSLFGDQTA